MNTVVTQRYTFTLTEDEREVLLDVLQQVLKEMRVELHRTESFAAQKVVSAKEALIESLLDKASVATRA